jgi:hypothetical protein
LNGRHTLTSHLDSGRTALPASRSPCPKSTSTGDSARGPKATAHARRSSPCPEGSVGVIGDNVAAPGPSRKKSRRLAADPMFSRSTTGAVGVPYSATLRSKTEAPHLQKTVRPSGSARGRSRTGESVTAAVRVHRASHHRRGGAIDARSRCRAEKAARIRELVC